jgi:dTDP-4-amino-4,6-dideoxygalactose transaminase
VYKYPLSYNEIDAVGLYKLLLNYQNRNHEELVSDFEETTSFMLNKSVVAVSSGTAALHLALAALQIGPGDLVAVPTFSYVASVNPVLYTGATPVWIDSEEATWNMSPELVARALRKFNSRSKRIKAIIVVHNYGVPANMKEIMLVAKQYGVPVIEDAAEAWGASIGKKPCGSIGEIGVFSFNNNKTVTAFGGGLVATSNRKLENRIRLLASHARLPKPYYLFEEVGYNYRMSPLVAAYGLLHLQDSRRLVEERRKNFAGYCFAFRNRSEISSARPLPGDDDSRWLPAFRFGSPYRLAKLIKELSKQGFEVRRGWNPLHTMKHLSGYPIFRSGVSELLFKEVICLPASAVSHQFASLIDGLLEKNDS